MTDGRIQAGEPMETADESAALTRKITRISSINAWSVMVIAGGFTLLSVLGWSVAGIVVGAAVTGAGVIELHGQKALQTDPARARQWMVGSQVWLTTGVLGYCIWRLVSLDPDDPFAVFGDAAQLFQLVELMGLSRAQLSSLFIQAYYITYGLIAGLTLLFQGGLALYYWSRIGRLVRSCGHTVPAPTAPQPDS